MKRDKTTSMIYSALSWILSAAIKRPARIKDIAKTLEITPQTVYTKIYKNTFTIADLESAGKASGTAIYLVAENHNQGEFRQKIFPIYEPQEIKKPVKHPVTIRI